MVKSKVVVFSAKGRDSLSISQSEALENVALVTYISNLKPMSDDELVIKCKDAKYIALTRRTCLNFHSDIIKKLQKLKGLSVYSTGNEWIDMQSIKDNNIRFRFLPDYSQQTVAEHAIAMLLNMSRRMHLSDRIARDDLNHSVSIRGWELSQKKLGIIGLGRIGSRIAELAKAFGMKVSYYDLKIESSTSIDSSSFDDLIKNSDIIMLASSVDRSKPQLINAEVIHRMKSGVYIINPSRQELVDNNAIITAIKSKKIAGYAVDDYVFSSSELQELEHGRVLQTGHSGWYSNEAMEKGTEMWISNLIELVSNE